MTASVETVRRAGDVALLAPRWSRVLRAAVLFVLGIVVLFTATLHSNTAFDIAIASSGIAAVGVVHFIEWAQLRGHRGAVISLLMGLVSIVSAGLVFALHDQLVLAVGIAAWALVCALLEFVGMTVAPGSRQDAAIVGAAGVLLSITVLLSRNDVVAVIGFFGGYAIIAGVFLGIAAFDTRRERDASELGAPTMNPAANVES